MVFWSRLHSKLESGCPYRKQEYESQSQPKQVSLIQDWIAMLEFGSRFLPMLGCEPRSRMCQRQQAYDFQPVPMLVDLHRCCHESAFLPTLANLVYY